jgi:hypothetical protein
MVLLERSLRFHHPGTGALAQSLNILGCEFLFCGHHPVSLKRRRNFPAA